MQLLIGIEIELIFLNAFLIVIKAHIKFILIGILALIMALKCC